PTRYALAGSEPFVKTMAMRSCAAWARFWPTMGGCVTVAAPRDYCSTRSTLALDPRDTGASYWTASRRTETRAFRIGEGHGTDGRNNPVFVQAMASSPSITFVLRPDD